MNINAAKELVRRYEKLTPGYLAEVFHELKEKYDDDEYSVTGDNVMHHITGFGNYETCMLCKEAKELSDSTITETYCHNCIYSLSRQSYEGYFYCITQSYDDICDALNADDLYKALQERIKNLKELIKRYEEQKANKSSTN